MEEHGNQNRKEEQAPRLIAHVDVGQGKAAAQRFLLTEQALQVHDQARSRAFSLAYVQRLAVEHRVFWLPLLGGALLASLSMLKLLNTFTMPFLLLGGVAVGLLSVWWGVRGSMALVVYEQQHRNDILLQESSAALQVFVAFSNRVIRRYPASLGDYGVALTLQELQQLQERGAITLPVPRACAPVEYLQRYQLDSDEFWLLVDPLQLGQRVHWALRGQELVATVQGELLLQEVRFPTAS